MKRRKFIQKSGLLLSVGTLIKASGIFSGFNMTAMAATPMLSSLQRENDNILVLIQLVGGNDGLNTVIPLDVYDNLANLRSNILIPENKIIKLTDKLGFHPELHPLAKLWNDKKLSIIQNVGYPEQNRSHFRSSDIWSSGSPSDEVWTSGWIGRYLEKLYNGYPNNFPNADFPDPLAINIGNSVSETCQGKLANFGFALNHPDELTDLDEESMELIQPVEMYNEMQFIQTNIQQTNAYSKVILKANDKGRNSAVYPEDNKLAQQLKVVAKLISGGLKTKIYVLTLDGFDHHANQVAQDNHCEGNHADCLRTVANAIASFQEDLRLLNLEKRVLGITVSEFGRQIQSNNSFGTDHGTAAPLFVFGSSIKSSVIGNNPVITKAVDVQAGVDMQIDFRDVYGSILVDWLGLSKEMSKKFFRKELVPISIV
ncbi:MAG: DUF1501 domain-containing protein [Chitinophagales bacterium]